MSEHEHTWRDIGRCNHPHSSGSNAYQLFVCTGDCGRFGHRGPITFACGRRQGPVPPADCPVGTGHPIEEVEVLVDRYQAEEYDRTVRVEKAVAAAGARRAV